MCIIDTGVDWQHPDLAGNLWMNQKEVHGPGATAANGYQNGIDDDNDGEDLACMCTVHSSMQETLHHRRILCMDKAALCIFA